MKRFLPLLLGAAALLVLIVVLVAGKGNPVRRMDERISLRQRDKIPYGTAVAKHLLPSLFTSAAVLTDSRYPGAWHGIDNYQSNQAVFIIADYFNADEEELERLNYFVDRGNDVFIIARAFSRSAAQNFNLGFSSSFGSYLATENDSIRLHLQPPTFTAAEFSYPGKSYAGAVLQMDSARTAVLGTNGDGFANFVQMNRGSGRFFIHTAPLAFSNYFILHKQNNAYFRQVLSVIPKNVKAVLWNEYFLEKRQEESEKDEANWLATLFRFPAFRWGMITALVTLALYVLLGMRRKQRVIPPHGKPQNDSLDFVKTLGRLYYDKRDHKNLAEKMTAYFLEHVRSTFAIPTHTLDKDFVKTLHGKSGYPEPELQEIVATIEQVWGSSYFSEEHLAYFHKQLELFYQNT